MIAQPFPISILSEAVKERFAYALDNPVFLMTNPAFALMAYDQSEKRWLQSPLDVWTRCADAVSWDGVIPTTCTYQSSSGSTTCMVALKTSPIWQRLADASDSSLQGDARCLLSNIGRREWIRLCDSAGISCGLEKTEHVAKAVKDAQEAVGGKGAYGASAKPEAVMKSRRVTQRLGYGKNVENRNPAKSSIWQKIKKWFARLSQGE